MTLRLYYHDPYLREFSAVVLAERQHGDKPAVTLDRTIFYPTSGGQPHDTGFLGQARILDVQEEEGTGAILHILDSPIPLGPVAGRIDWDRRFDHMQQHTGQHILSQAFVRVAQAPTVSFHLGEETSTIDLELPQPTSSLMRDAEDLASQIVFEDRPVHVLTADREALRTLGVRKESQREGDIRVIDVEGFDRSPCGGTHVRRSGEIGIIAILGFERYKGGTRAEFACGGRALRTFRRDHEVLKELARLHSAHPYETPRLTEKLLQERAALTRETAKLRDQAQDWEALELLSRADKLGEAALVCRSFSGRTIESLKVLAQKITARSPSVAILGQVQDAAQLVVARSSNLPGDCGAAVKEAAARLGGRGGGRPDIAQAGGIAAGALQSWFDALQEHFRASMIKENPQGKEHDR